MYNTDLLSDITLVFTRSYRFQKALKAYGVADLDVFQTVDLYECKDFAQVITTLFSLGREVSNDKIKNNINR